MQLHDREKLRVALGRARRQRGRFEFSDIVLLGLRGNRCDRGAQSVAHSHNRRALAPQERVLRAGRPPGRRIHRTRGSAAGSRLPRGRSPPRRDPGGRCAADAARNLALDTRRYEAASGSVHAVHCRDANTLAAMSGEIVRGQVFSVIKVPAEATQNMHWHTLPLQYCIAQQRHAAD